MDLTRPGQDGDLMVDINTTPLIDVMLVLLIMLIITVPMQTHAVKLDMGASDAQSQPVEPETVRLAIDFDGTLSWNGALLPDRAALETALRDAAHHEPQPEIQLAPHKLVRYATVAMVLAESQRMGMTRIGIVGEPLAE